MQADGRAWLNEAFVKIILQSVEPPGVTAVLMTWFKSSDANHGTPETSVSGVYCVQPNADISQTRLVHSAASH
jgi:hypothetical protein